MTENNEYVPEFQVFNTETKKIDTIKDLNETDFYIGGLIYPIVCKMRKRHIIDSNGFIHVPMKNLVTTEYDCDDEDSDFNENDDIEEADDVFFVRLKNSELTGPIKALKKFIEKGKIVSAKSVSELITNTRHMMELGHITVPSVHIEILLRNLIRDANNPINLPDWSEIKKDEDITITSIQRGILFGPSLLTGLSFERLGQQLKNTITYKKTEPGITDYLYMDKSVKDEKQSDGSYTKYI